MYSLLLVVIYLAFISLGLPDSLLGSAWPVMQGELEVPISFAGIVTMIIAGGTVISSLFSDELTRRFGAGRVTAVSVLMTAVALMGFSRSHSFVLLCAWAVPYGLGAGAVDAALNNYVALHYASRHMSWLHCFWGVGATISPYIMGFCLSRGYGWASGYRTVGFLQIALAAILFISLPLWGWKNSGKKGAEGEARSMGVRQTLKIKGVPFILITFFSYCALEQTAMLWSSSYLVQFRGFSADRAARLASLCFFGITFGRFLSGFVADQLGDRRLIRIGIATAGAGCLLVALPVTGAGAALAGLLLIGFGCAPIYPSIIHATPFNFGKENSQAVIGIQMASAYMGNIFMPPLFGLIASRIHMGLFPVYLFFFAVLMFLMSEKLNKVVGRAV